jgi:SulP family sulfate permease
VIGAVIGFLNVPALRRVARLRRDSFALALLALFGVLVLGVLGGLLLAVAISIVLLLGRQSRPGSSVLGRIPGTSAYAAVDATPGVQTEPGLLIFRLDAPLLFVNAKLVRDQVRARLEEAKAPVRIVLLAAVIGEAHLYRTIADAMPDVRAVLSS